MITTIRHNTVLEIILDNPPVNALGSAVRRAINGEIARASADPSVAAIVIRGRANYFSAGADITEFDAPPIDPALPDLIDRIEASPKPVIAAITGPCLGGGLELALGCHYRLVTPSARLGLPEVKLGLLPGAGGTQRLPRLVGIEKALSMIVSGNAITGADAASIGLADELAPEDVLAEQAVVFAREATGPRPTGERTISADEGVFDRFVAGNPRSFGALEAPKACVEAVKAAAALPLRQGLEVEQNLFRALVSGEQSIAQRYIFFAERKAARIEDMPADVVPRVIERVGIIGAGTMGGGIAMNFLSADIPVTIVETSEEALTRGVALVRANYKATAAKGRISSEDVSKALGLLEPTLDFSALADCDLVIEAAYENMDLKKEIFAQLDKIAKPGTILASNTSYLSIDEIAQATSRPEDVIGMHFFSPANVMKLLEVVRGVKTGFDVLKTAMTLGRRIGKVPVVSGVCYGFIGNRMLIPRQEQATNLLLEGATPQQIDRVHTAFGMPMGPFQMADLAGVDIGWHRNPNRIESISDALCAQQRWGQKTQGGYYDYDDKRKPTPSPVTEEIVTGFRKAVGIEPRSISDEEIIVRTLYSMINEAALILEEGIAQRESDIDVVWVHGYGWPRWYGGPMHWARTLGFGNISDALLRYRRAFGEDFSPATYLLQ